MIYCLGFEPTMSDSRGKVTENFAIPTQKNSELTLFAYDWAEYPYPPGQGVLIWGPGSYSRSAVT